MGATEEQGLPVSAGVQTDLVEVMLVEAPDVTHSLHIILKGYMQAPIMPRNVLNGAYYLYHGNDLGNTYNPHLLLYGEPWAGGTSSLPANEILIRGRQKGLGLAVFNDHLRDGRGGSVFDSTARGFATGARGLVEEIKSAVEGSINAFTTSPQETINYVTSHDNYTLWDKITRSGLRGSIRVGTWTTCCALSIQEHSSSLLLEVLWTHENGFW